MPDMAVDISFDPAAIAEWCEGHWHGTVPESIRGVSTDSRTLDPGEIYIALCGDNFDGHTFVADAFRRGAAAAVVQADRVPVLTDAGPLLKVRDPEYALRQIAAGHRERCRATAIAITGSAGKTTVKDMVACALRAECEVAATPGNWNNHIGLPLSMLRMHDTDQYGVFEIGTNHPGEVGALCDILRPAWGVVTTVGAAHTAYFESIDAIADEKASVLRCLPDTGLACLCRDDRYFEYLANAATCRVTTLSWSQDADYVCVDYDADGGQVSIREAATGEVIDFRAPLAGRHNVTNVLFAVAIAREAGVGVDGIRAAVEQFRPSAMRWERLSVAGVAIVNDAYNANPLSVRAALSAFARESGEGRKWLVLGDMLELGDAEDDEHRKIGTIVAGDPWAGVITVGPRAQRIAEGACAAGFAADNVASVDCNEAAAAILKKWVKTDDSVLLKGSRGMKLEEIVVLLSA
jgi:UDP-N-acetylmuramoyl-tripeptide--D-alanyl-D-alanine ligase